MKIEIHYRLRGEDVPRSVVLAPEEYCDPLQPGETHDRHGVAQFDHAVDYLDHPAREVEWTRLEVTREGVGRTVTTSRFAADGASNLWQRRDPDGGQEMCLDLLAGPGRHLVARLRLDANGDWVPGYTGVIEELPDGSQTEERIRFVAP